MENINFKLWLKKEDAAASAPAVAAPASAVSQSNGSSTTTSDIAKVPMKLGCGQSCGKDFFKNWSYKKKKK